VKNKGRLASLSVIFLTIIVKNLTIEFITLYKLELGVMFMLNKNKTEKVELKLVDLEIFIAQLFESCKNEHEVELLQKELLNGNLDINISYILGKEY
jgi:hypothetical protein